ncbi:MAG: PspC domain-containing protein [Cryobacterium sp.]|uniref:PspC domain-containing protein n=1 Tax=unclassified Cryobacterium TaxID=2649013 RepID=UPI0018C95779|nr:MULTISPECIES: PspC domain-containing protein [unclassified Cryobacterium]MCY7403225.1 PspC domain-containing protein [Cryobacterium sp.]MEC5154528.1 signal transduction histidine kinase/phage shock protein PspC (stress-responsive transcriptional regulator) [Cryobacterium sp. CAN_C3]
MRTERITRPRLRLLGGVCAGFADHTGLPVTTVRVATMLLSLCGGAGVLLYAWLWATTPSTVAPTAAEPLPKSSLARAVSPAASRATDVSSGSARMKPDAPGIPDLALRAPAADAQLARAAPVTEILLGLALLAAGIALVASRLGANIPLAVVVPGIVVLAGTALAWRQFADVRSGAAQQSSALAVRTLGALVLVAVGILLFFVTGDSPNVWTVILAAASVLLAVIVVIAPWVLRLWSDLADERAAREREAERAEIAAHLHDSVLQTLALIQQKAGPHSEAARLARAQERELREWLFTGSSGGTTDLATELRRIASAIEADFTVHFEVVSAGVLPGEAPRPLVAAAREAMLNAARHAGGPVSVYLEIGRRGLELSVTDRGPGFARDTVPEDRLGVRESIIGRMRRAGGTAVVRSGPGGTGTEILLTLPPIPNESPAPLGDPHPQETSLP